MCREWVPSVHIQGAWQHNAISRVGNINGQSNAKHIRNPPRGSGEGKSRGAGGGKASHTRAFPYHFPVQGSDKRWLTWRVKSTAIAVVALCCCFYCCCCCCLIKLLRCIKLNSCGVFKRRIVEGLNSTKRDGQHHEQHHEQH